MTTSRFNNPQSRIAKAMNETAESSFSKHIEELKAEDNPEHTEITPLPSQHHYQ